MTTEFWFDNLSEQEREWIANGCGPKGGWILVPEFSNDHRRICDIHDFLYWIGCTEADRLAADRRFLSETLHLVSKEPWYLRGFYKVAAWVYYRAVRTFGKNSFYYGPRPRTYDDLRREMGKT